MLAFRHMNTQIVAFLWTFLVLCNIYQIFGDTSADSWLIFARQTKKILNKCYINQTDFDDSWSCVKRNSLILFDDMRSGDTIPLTNMIELIRRPNSQLPARRYDAALSNETSWIEEVKRRIVETLYITHNIRFAFPRNAGEARRRHRFRMFPPMIFGMAVLGVIIIPIGFHIMSVIGGLALLLGKMAMLVATITSLKRHDHFGYYYAEPHHPYAPGPWDRNDRYDPKKSSNWLFG